MGIRIIWEKEIDEDEDDLSFEPPKDTKGLQIKETKEEEPSKRTKIPRCPNCGHRMRRIYAKQGYRQVEGRLFKRTKHKTNWWKIGWWCPFCDYVRIEPEYFW